MKNSPAKKSLVKWLLLFLAWTVLGLFSASQIYIRYAYYSEHQPTWRQAFNVAFSDWYAWALLSPIILRFAERFPLERGVKKRRWLAHVLVGLLLSGLKMFIEIKLFQLATGVTRQITVPQVHSNLLTYGAIIGIFYAFNYYRKYREHELRASQLEARLSQAQLQALKMQVHPHFLFNTLHAISTLIHKDVEAADRMIARLSDLLRLALENAGVQEVPLKQELAFLERYLEIERIRFSDRLTIHMNVAPETLDALVPNLILQPLVENAVRHGVAPRSAPGVIAISTQRENGRLFIEVRDNGPGLSQGQLKEGVGLMNTRARLQQLYSEAQRFEISNAPEGGLLVRLAVPLRFGPGEAYHEN